LALAKPITDVLGCDIAPGAVTGAAGYAIRKHRTSKYFAVHPGGVGHISRKLAVGSIDDGRCVCPWHHPAYDVETAVVADPNRSSRDSRTRNDSSKIADEEFGLVDAAPYRCGQRTSSSNNWRAARFAGPFLGDPPRFQGKIKVAGSSESITTQ